MSATLERINSDRIAPPDSIPELAALAPKTPRSRRLLLMGLAGGVFLFGLVIMCAAVGAWYFISPGTNTGKSKEAIVSAAADRYWNTFNLNQAKRDVAGIDPYELAQTIDTLEQQTSDPQKRTRLVLLAAGLDLPIPERPIWTTLLQDPIIRLGLFIPLIPILAAAIFLVIPLVKDVLGGISRMAEPAVSETADEAEAPESTPVDALTAIAGEDMPLTAESEEIEEPVEIPQVNPAEAKKEEVEEEELDEEEEEAEEEASKPEAILEDLANIFEYEDTSLSTLEAFCKELPELDLKELLSQSQRVAHGMRLLNMPREQARERELVLAGATR